MFNKAILIGRLTADPELRQTTSGNSVASFRIAVDRRFTSQDGERQTDFLSIVAWRRNAEFVQRFFHKGDLIGVEGSIQSRSYEDKQGNKRTAVEIVADNLFFVNSKSEQRSSAGAPANAAAPQSSAAPAQPAAPKQQGVAYANGADSDFEEVEIDNDLPF